MISEPDPRLVDVTGLLNGFDRDPRDAQGDPGPQGQGDYTNDRRGGSQRSGKPLGFIQWRDLPHLEYRDEVIEGMIESGSIVVKYGPFHSGKSFECLWSKV